MSVVIKDMDKPRICAECPLCMIYADDTFDEYWCMRLNRTITYPNQDVLKDCPIEEQKIGHWVPLTLCEVSGCNPFLLPDDNPLFGHACSRCHALAQENFEGEELLTNYCPECGAKMVMEDDNIK